MLSSEDRQLIDFNYGAGQQNDTHLREVKNGPPSTTATSPPGTSTLPHGTSLTPEVSGSGAQQLTAWRATEEFFHNICLTPDEYSWPKHHSMQCSLRPSDDGLDSSQSLLSVHTHITRLT
eukprot:GHVN01102236.1.p1 GENE.GHVN01102236.1~~GHVN01102236.1.p1  ORF type:complete len:120 (-),score=40.09 GHVN01102236.1:17-376(-)